MRRNSMFLWLLTLAVFCFPGYGQETAADDKVAEEKADVVITAKVSAQSLKFEIVPKPEVGFPGKPQRKTEWSSERSNLPKSVEPGVTYRDIGITLKIASVFADIERIVDEALGTKAESAAEKSISQRSPATSENANKVPMKTDEKEPIKPRLK